MQGESGIGEALVAWAEGFREGSLEVEHSTKGSGGDFLMVLMPFFVWEVALAAHVYDRNTVTVWGPQGLGTASLPKRKLPSVFTFLRFSRLRNP